MEPANAPLCEYCELRPPRPGDAFCCDGCRVLADTAGGPVAPGRPALRLESAPDDPILTREYGRDDGNAVRFECFVEPLACEACLRGLHQLERLVPGLHDLQWNRASSILSFRFPRGSERPSRAFEFLGDLRLSPRWKSSNDGSRRNERRRTMRLGLTGALAGNIMLFAVPIYGGLTGDLRDVFEWIQFALFLPIFLWSARPFYRTAWVSLRLRRLSVDLPLTAAFVAGSLFSAASLFRGGHDLYFDSLAGFLFFILWSRSLLEKSLAKYLEAPSLERFFEKPVFPVARDGRGMRVPWNEIRPGDVLSLGTGDRLPVDGHLASSSAEIETAWMTGEKTPHWRLRGSLLQAGSRLLSREAEVVVTRAAVDTDFARLLGRLETAGQKLTPTLEARLGSALVLTCFAAIAVLFAFGASLGLDEVARRSVALLIVACPCAVSFAAPLARAKANRIAFKHGFWIHDPLVWTRLNRVRRISFDKTGTLTGGLFTPAPDSPLVDRHWKQIILTLENVSRHPVAESLRRAWGPYPLLEVRDAREVPGRGVEGEIGGSRYDVRAVPSAEGHLRVELRRDGRKVVEIPLQDDAAPGVEAALARLREHHELSIISGDHPIRVQDFGSRYGFAPDKVFGGLSADEKKRKIEELAPDVYFGDGTNDLQALRAAPVSIAVGAASLEARAASDILMYDSDLGRCRVLFEIARETARLNRRNLGLALAYNLAAGAAALAGLVNPLAAAVLMPVASMVLLVSTLRGTAGSRRLETGA